jgi:hypothetical protein
VQTAAKKKKERNQNAAVKGKLSVHKQFSETEKKERAKRHKKTMIRTEKRQLEIMLKKAEK